MESPNLINDLRDQSQSAADAMATGALAREDGGRGEGQRDVDGEEEATFFDLELPLSGDQSVASAGGAERVEVELDFVDDGEEVVTAELQAASAEEAGHGVEAVPVELALGPAARLRGILHKLRKPKAAEKPGGSGGASSPEEQSRLLVKDRVDIAPRSGVCTIAGNERRAPKEAVLKYLSKIITLARRRGDREGPDLSRPSHSQATTDVAAGSSRAPVGKRLGKSRSSVAAAPPALPQQRSDDSLLQVQDGIESAIAHCKLSLDASRGKLLGLPASGPNVQ